MWNAKVRCKQVWCKLDTRGFKIGKTYDVKNGKLIFPNGKKSKCTYDCIEKLNESFYAVFEEVKE